MLVCLGANALFYPQGGHVWAYLNWALAFRSAGCEVLWLESGREDEGPALRNSVQALASALAPYGLADRLIVDTVRPLPDGCAARPIEAALDADLFVDLAYTAPEVTRAFRRSALIDIDPGSTQMWWSRGDLDLGAYHTYFTVGEGVSGGQAAVPDCGVRWLHTPPCVDLGSWPPCPAPLKEAAWTTVTHWWGEWDELAGEPFDNSKAAAFRPVLGMARRVDVAIELAIGGLDDAAEQTMLESRGWRVVDAAAVAATTDDHRRYVQRSRGEFSVAKPLYVELATGWVSDRTVCYLASARPALVQDTGAAEFGAGLVAFTRAEDAAVRLQAIEAEYEHHSAAARALAEERFAGAVVAPRMLADALS
jgi:hypothetical protein